MHRWLSCLCVSISIPLKADNAKGVAQGLVDMLMFTPMCNPCNRHVFSRLGTTEEQNEAHGDGKGQGLDDLRYGNHAE